MGRSLGCAVALALTAPGLLLPAHSRTSDRTLPMHFELRLQGPAETCGTSCAVLISASGAIVADTARDFKLFVQDRDLSGATVVLDSDGGSVLGAIALGREIRRLALATTVGRTIDIAPAGTDKPRAVLSPQADCESMCAFVLLGGVRRIVPPEARVMVHQIWLGDRRDDPAAASYSAEDLVVVQRDIGRLAQYTADMGATNDLLDLALRIPPWEPMHAMTRDEMRRTRLATGEPADPAAATVAASPPAAATQPAPRMTNGLRATEIGDRRWAMVDRAGAAALARRHPLTAEGENIGSFDLMVACGAGGNSYKISYVERRHGGDHTPVPAKLGMVTVRVQSASMVLKVVSSERHSEPDELVSYAAATVPAALIGAFAAAGTHSMVVETESDGVITVIRFGNTGAQQNLPQLAAGCGKAIGDRADVPVKKSGGLAAAQ
jgi:hypothetical protein